VNRLTQACTIVIAIALAAIAWKLCATPSPVFAAQHYAYKSFSDMNFNAVTRTLNQDAAEGWEPVSVFSDARSGVFLVVERRPKQ
jgi:hypothetical protein